MAKVCEIKRDNPSKVYEYIGKLGKGALGIVVRVKNKTDGKEYAMKYTEPKNVAEREMVINEVSLLRHLHCD